MIEAASYLIKKNSAKKLEECMSAAWNDILDIIVEQTLRHAASADALDAVVWMNTHADSQVRF